MTTYFLNLAVADFGLLAALLAFATFSVAESSRGLSVSSSLQKMLVFFFFFFASDAAFYFLTAISVERCLSVFFPIWYRLDRPKCVSAIVSFLVWTTSGLLSGVTMSFYWAQAYESSVVMLELICAVNVLIIIPLVVLSTLGRFTRICCSSQQDQPRKLYIVLLLSLIFFLFFASAFSVFGWAVYLDYTPLPVVLSISFLLAAFNSAANPVVHYILGGQMKLWLKREPEGWAAKLFE